jgi:hypothetical protein
MIAEQQIPAHPMLEELKQLIDNAWAEYTAKQPGTAATQSQAKRMSDTPVRVSTAIAADDRVGQQPALTSRPSQPTSPVVPEIANEERPDRATQVMLQHFDTLLEEFKVTDSTSQAQPERHGEGTPSHAWTSTR